MHFKFNAFVAFHMHFCIYYIEEWKSVWLESYTKIFIFKVNELQHMIIFVNSIFCKLNTLFWKKFNAISEVWNKNKFRNHNKIDSSWKRQFLKRILVFTSKCKNNVPNKNKIVSLINISQELFFVYLN